MSNVSSINDPSSERKRSFSFSDEGPILETLDYAIRRPDLTDFQDGLGEVIGHFQEAVLSVHNLVPDIYFQAFTRFVHV